MAEALSELRAHYPATEREVNAWVDDLYSDTDAEMQPFAYEESSGYRVAYGYDTGTYDDIEIGPMAPDAISKTYDDIGDPTDRPDQAHAAFLEMDTVISTYDRKR
jgi:hypothetical protein